MEEQVGYGNSKAVVDFEQKYPEQIGRAHV